MANIKSAIKRAKKANKTNIQNRTLRAALRTTVKNFEQLCQEQKIEEAKQFLPTVIKRIDKAAAKGLMHKKNASNKKSRLSKLINK